MICKNAFVVCCDNVEFANKVSEMLELFQNEGLKVEVQYRPVADKYTALIIGRSGNIIF